MKKRERANGERQAVTAGNRKEEYMKKTTVVNKQGLNKGVETRTEYYVM